VADSIDRNAERIRLEREARAANTLAKKAAAVVKAVAKKK